MLSIVLIVLILCLFASEVPPVVMCFIIGGLVVVYCVNMFLKRDKTPETQKANKPKSPVKDSEGSVFTATFRNGDGSETVQRYSFSGKLLSSNTTKPKKERANDLC